MDLITGNRFKEACDYYYESYSLVQQRDLVNPSNTQTVFCETHYVKEFMEFARWGHNNIILVSHNSDGCIVPYKWRDCDYNFQEHKLPKKIIAWYAQNMHVLSDRIRPIPMGLENYKWHKGSKWAEIEAMSKQDMPRDKWLYLNVQPATNPIERNTCIDALKNKGFVTNAVKVPYLQYLTEMKRHKFVACPEGNGWDCHRTWEALYMGCIPIVRKRYFTEMFSRLVPLLIIEDWNEVSLEKLDKFYYHNKQWEEWEERSKHIHKGGYDALTFKFWEKVIRGEIKIA